MPSPPKWAATQYTHTHTHTHTSPQIRTAHVVWILVAHQPRWVEAGGKGSGSYVVCQWWHSTPSPAVWAMSAKFCKHHWCGFHEKVLSHHQKCTCNHSGKKKKRRTKKSNIKYSLPLSTNQQNDKNKHVINHKFPHSPITQLTHIPIHSHSTNWWKWRAFNLNTNSLTVWLTHDPTH